MEQITDLAPEMILLYAKNENIKLLLQQVTLEFALL